MITVEIDGKKIEVKEGTSIIQAAENAGIWIPRFCYHKKLSIAANCRMCLVEVEKAPKPVASCATPVMEGMRVFTTSEKALTAQKIVMEFLLINHPLDCPVCDQGGECELQDIAMGYGRGVSQYAQGKRAVADEDLGPLIATEMTRCIHCTRCVRFGTEVAGLREMGMTGRGEHSSIGTYIKHTVTHELSGNIIDLCPVGALTSKPNRFEGRSWEFDQKASIAPHDMIGSNVFVHSLREQVMRVVPSENESLNEVWLSDRDRFSYEGMRSHHRLQTPRIKRNGKWHTVTWTEALAFASEGLRVVHEKWGGDQIGALVSPNATTEEFYLLNRLMRGLGSNNIDHRLRETDFSDEESRGAFPGMNTPLQHIENQEAILVIGADLRAEVPLLAHRVRKAFLKGAKVMAVSMLQHDFNFPLAENIVASPQTFVETLAGIIKALYAEAPHAPEPPWLKSIALTSQHRTIAGLLRASNKTMIIIGHMGLHHPHAATVRALANNIADIIHAQVSHVTDGANSAGAWMAGAIPHRSAGGESLQNTGAHYLHMIQQPLRAYVTMGFSPDLDTAHPALCVNALQQADFVVALSAFTSDALSESEALFNTADVILPMVPFAETSGTFINGMGDWQRFCGALKPLGEARPGWKILRVLGTLLKLEHFEYQSSEEVLEAVKAVCDAQDIARLTDRPLPIYVLPESHAHLTKVTQVPLYRSDALVRHAPALQKMVDKKHSCVRFNARTLEALRVEEGDVVDITEGAASYALPVMMDNALPDNTAGFSAAMMHAALQQDFFGPITIKKRVGE